MDMNFSMTTSGTTTHSSSSSHTVNGKTVSKSSSTTVTKTKKGKKTVNGAVVEYETSGNVESVEFDPSQMGQGFHMEFNTAAPVVTHEVTHHEQQVSPNGTVTVTHTVSSPTHTHVTHEVDVNAQAVANAALAGVASLFAPKPQVVVKETHTVYVPAPAQPIVYQAPKPAEPEVSDVRYECTSNFEEAEVCFCCKRMDPEKAKRYNKLYGDPQAN